MWGKKKIEKEKTRFENVDAGLIAIQTHINSSFRLRENESRVKCVPIYTYIINISAKQYIILFNMVKFKINILTVIIL